MEQLKQTEELYRIILDQVGEGVFVVDKEMRIIYFNDAAEELTGFSRSEAVGQHCYQILRSPHCPADCALKQTIDTGKPVKDRELCVYARDNVRIPIAASTSPLYDGKGRLVGGVEIFRDLSDVVLLRQELKKNYTMYDIITRNRTMLEMIALLPDMAGSDLPVLIEGESGTGKELVARALHNLSRRSTREMVLVNCAAIPENLMESELFGYRKGAFTGAVKDRKGKILSADRSSLFLDEIGELPLPLQAKLLRVLEDKTVEALGADRPEEVDFRLVAATHRPLDNLVNEGAFREDLFYRLNVIRITIPPLRERREDIPLLVEAFLQRLNAQLNKSITGCSQEVEKLLMNYDYPGNVRQLKHLLEYAAVLCRGATIHRHHIPPEIREKDLKVSNRSLPLIDLEKRSIQDALNHHGGNVSRAARMLGIHRTTLWRKMKKYGIK